MSKKIVIDKEEMDKEEKRAAFMDKASKNKANFDLHRDLIEKHLCSGNKMYSDDLKIFYERQVVDNVLLLKLMEYAEEYHKEKTKELATEQSLIEQMKAKEKFNILYKWINDNSNEINILDILNKIAEL